MRDFKSRVIIIYSYDNITDIFYFIFHMEMQSLVKIYLTFMDEFGFEKIFVD